MEIMCGAGTTSHSIGGPRTPTICARYVPNTAVDVSDPSATV